MTYIDFLEEMQNYFGINMKVQQQAVTEQFIEQYDERDLQEIFTSLLETCKTIPRIAHIKEAADKAQIQKRAHEIRGGCERCNGTTWLQLIIKDPNTGFTSNAVETCTCFPRKIKDHPDKLVGYIPIREDQPMGGQNSLGNEFVTAGEQRQINRQGLDECRKVLGLSPKKYVDLGEIVESVRKPFPDEDDSIDGIPF